MVDVDGLFKAAKKDPTVDSLLKTMETIVEAYKKLERENERLRRQLNNNSQNSSMPSSTDQKSSKAANAYNSREKSAKNKGAQKGHVGKTVTKEQVEALIKSGKVKHEIIEVGSKCQGQGRYVSKYVLDMEITTTVKEIRFYETANGKFDIPAAYHSDVTYGPLVKALSVLLYSEGVVSNDRIQMIVTALTDNTLPVSTGSIYNFCKQAAKLGANELSNIEKDVLASEVVNTDGTNVLTDGKQTYIRNCSTAEVCLYEYFTSKSRDSLRESAILPKFENTFVHDHETVIYNFGRIHGECNAHILRYLKKNMEETHNPWSEKMAEVLCVANELKREAIALSKRGFSQEEIDYLVGEYDSAIREGWKQNAGTKGFTASKEERNLLRRLEKYRDNHLLFLKNFRVPFTNNMSERDLRKCKNRQKIAGGFRTEDGGKMYCKILSLIETWKRKGLSLLYKLKSLFDVSPVGSCYATAYLGAP